MSIVNRRLGWCTLVILALRKLRQGDWEFKAVSKHTHTHNFHVLTRMTLEKI